VLGDTACWEATWQGGECLEELHCGKVGCDGREGQDTKEDLGNTARLVGMMSRK